MQANGHPRIRPWPILPILHVGTILGFVEGPGLAVLAQWTGTGLTLEGLAAADEFAAQVSDVPQATPDAETEDLLGQTVTCYSTLFAPEDGDDKKKDDKNAE